MLTRRFVRTPWALAGVTGWVVSALARTARFFGRAPDIAPDPCPFVDTQAVWTCMPDEVAARAEPTFNAA